MLCRAARRSLIRSNGPACENRQAIEPIAAIESKDFFKMNPPWIRQAHRIYGQCGYANHRRKLLMYNGLENFLGFWLLQINQELQASLRFSQIFHTVFALPAPQVFERGSCPIRFHALITDNCGLRFMTFDSIAADVMRRVDFVAHLFPPTLTIPPLRERSAVRQPMDNRIA